MGAAWPERNVAPFIAREADVEGMRQELHDGRMYPEDGITTPPGHQPYETWFKILTHMVETGIATTVVFETSEEVEAVG
ncbi:hypothetical protein LTR38_018396, partial [Friedmanniomyces endolithicus]